MANFNDCQLPAYQWLPTALVCPGQPTCPRYREGTIADNYLCIHNECNGFRASLLEALMPTPARLFAGQKFYYSGSDEKSKYSNIYVNYDKHFKLRRTNAFATSLKQLNNLRRA